MKIIHVSYVNVADHSEPSVWLRHISYFTGIASGMAREHETHSIHCINYDGMLKHQGVIYHFFKLNLWQRYFPFAVNNRVKRSEPDVVIVHGLHFSWQILLLGYQLPRTVRFFVQHHAEKPVRYHKKFLQWLNDRFIDGYFFSSAALAWPWVEHGLIKNDDRIHEVMEVSSSFGPIDRHRAKERTGVNTGLSYLWVGRLDANKDPETLLKGFIGFARLNPSVKLYVIFQNDQLLDVVKPLAAELPAQIELIGKVDHEDLLYWFNAVDFILSTSHYESGGIAVCEGMSCGCIPILSDIPSLRTMTENASVGLLFTPGDAEALAQVLYRSTSLNVLAEREKVLLQFRKSLSFEAIAKKMILHITR